MKHVNTQSDSTLIVDFDYLTAEGRVALKLSFKTSHRTVSNGSLAAASSMLSFKNMLFVSPSPCPSFLLNNFPTVDQL
jgi:hypothetical protein